VVLKTNNSSHTQLQNCAMYACSIAINSVATLAFAPANATVSSTLKHLTSWSQLCIITLLVAIGIVTSLLLRYIDSVSKAVASASETAITAIIGGLFFG